MNLTDAEKNEFLIESTELLEDAEKGLLNIDRGAPFLDNYNSIFRAFHSLKGASGMIGLMDLSNHLHKIETLFTEQKTKSEISKAHVDFFLRAIDASRELLDGNTIEFDYTINENKTETQTITITRDHITENKPIAKAMVVDDETDLLEEIAELLKDNLIESLCFTNAKDALAKITEYQPDVILSDITMPSMNGGEFLKELRKIDPDIPLIYISGNVSKEFLVEAIHSGITDVIEKPFKNERVASSALSAALRHQTTKLLKRSINLIMYQYSGLDEFLQKAGKEDIRQFLKNEFTSILLKRRELQDLSSKEKSR